MFLLWLLACGGPGSDTGDTATADCSLEAQLTDVYDLFGDYYLWYDHLPSLDPTTYPSVGTLIDDLRYDACDRWSYAAASETYSAWFDEGRYVGLGMELRYDDVGDVRFALVYPGSPMDEGGVERGHRLVSVNGESVADIDARDGWSTAWGETEPGTEVTVEVEDLDAAVTTLDLEMDWVDIQTVLATQEVSPGVGFLYFDAFLDTSINELEDAFGELQEAGITELIVDLRYNGGGRLDTSLALAELIAGPDAAGEVFLHYSHNDQHLDADADQIFDIREEALGLDRVVFIVTGGTASASEALINGLDPFIDVVLVGETTYGKPVGMYGWEICDLVVAPISFRMVNSDGVTDFFDGIPADCAAGDTLTEPLGSTADEGVAAALSVIEGSGCEAPVARPRPPRRLLDRPIGAW